MLNRIARIKTQAQLLVSHVKDEPTDRALHDAAIALKCAYERIEMNYRYDSATAFAHLESARQYLWEAHLRTISQRRREAILKVWDAIRSEMDDARVLRISKELSDEEFAQLKVLMDHIIRTCVISGIFDAWDSQYITPKPTATRVPANDVQIVEDTKATEALILDLFKGLDATLGGK